MFKKREGDRIVSEVFKEHEGQVIEICLSLSMKFVLVENTKGL